MPQGVAFAFLTGYACIAIGMLLTPFVLFTLLAISFTAKKPAPRRRTRRRSPDPENAHDDA
jgi:hypothetical protein